MSRSYTVEGESGYPRKDPYRFFTTKLPLLRELARDASKKAFSYREKPVRVGSSALSIVEFTPIWGVTTGFNTKKSPRVEKNCSELKTLQKAKSGGFNRVIGMWIASSTTLDEIEGIIGMRAPTLVPCDVCHGEFVANPIVEPDTLIITGGIDHDIIQVNTVKRLARIMREGDEDAIKDRVIGLSDFDRIVNRYDELYKIQKFVPEEKRLTGPELVVTSILSHTKSL